jgi:hypothetical protein
VLFGDNVVDFMSGEDGTLRNEAILAALTSALSHQSTHFGGDIR